MVGRGGKEGGCVLGGSEKKRGGRKQKHDGRWRGARDDHPSPPPPRSPTAPPSPFIAQRHSEASNVCIWGRAPACRGAPSSETTAPSACNATPSPSTHRPPRRSRLPLLLRHPGQQLGCFEPLAVEPKKVFRVKRVGRGRRGLRPKRLGRGAWACRGREAGGVERPPIRGHGVLMCVCARCGAKTSVETRERERSEENTRGDVKARERDDTFSRERARRTNAASRPASPLLRAPPPGAGAPSPSRVTPAATPACSQRGRGGALDLGQQRRAVRV